MTDRPSKQRLAGQQQASLAMPFHDVLGFDDTTITLGEALERPLLPGLYAVLPDSGRGGCLCTVTSGGAVIVHASSPARAPRKRVKREPKPLTKAQAAAKVRALQERTSTIMAAIAALRSGE